MIDWIGKTIDPPGIEKKNRLALFSVIGEVMSKVTKDAEQAFYAHFPYLADDKKLEEHGKALFIPHLLHDMPEEYRNRVASASFFLMKAGERAYIMSQIEERFGSRFIVFENFLEIHTKVTDLTDDERAWVLELLDSLTNPNIYLELSDWFHYYEKVCASDKIPSHAAYRKDADIYDNNSHYRDGSILRNGKTVRKYGLDDTITACVITTMADTTPAKLPRNGILTRNSERIRQHWLQSSFDAFPSFVTHTALTDSIVNSETFSTSSIGNKAKDVFDQITDAFNPRALCALTFQDTVLIDDTYTLGTRKHRFHNGAYQRNADIVHDGMALIPLA